MEWYEILVRLVFAVLSGFIVGLERERKHRPAGIKTHVLVCTGACLISLMQCQIVEDIIVKISQNPELSAALKADYGRLGAQVISGIGFIGAGTILHNKGSIKGLTTAATLWLVACLGLTIGMGYYMISFFTLAIVMIMLFTLKFAQARLQNREGTKILEFRFVNKKDTLNIISSYMSSKFIAVKRIEFIEESEAVYNGMPIQRCFYTIQLPRTIEASSVITDLNMENDIIYVSEAEPDPE